MLTPRYRRLKSHDYSSSGEFRNCKYRIASFFFSAENRIINREVQDDYAVKTAAMNKLRTQSTKIEVGEIELWAMSDPHRSVYPDAKEARVKLVVMLKDGSTEKYQAYFSRSDFGRVWLCNSLGKLSSGLFPRL